MKIEKINIYNFRGFGETHISFNDNVNLFIGNNGAGKSTLLNAIVKNIFTLTKDFVEGVSNEMKSKLALTSKDYKHRSIEFCIIKTTLTYPKSSNSINLLIYRNTKSVALKADLEALSKDKEKIDKFQDKIIESKRVPIIKFYPTNRGAISYKEPIDIVSNKIPQLDAWTHIYQDQLSYSSFFDWFFENESKELRFKRDENDFNVELPQLKVVRDAIIIALKKLFHKDYEIVSEQYKREGTNTFIKTISIVEKETKQKESLDAKSDGEKAIIALVADIAYNLSIAANPEDEDILANPGIVLIDEIEQHLHPTWQRAIVPLLTELFPNIQFFITTHSPQVVSSVKSENIFLINDFKVEPLQFKTKGIDSNTLLEYVFNSFERPEEYLNLVKKFENLIDEKAEPEKVEAVINEIDHLTNQDTGKDIDSLPSELRIRLAAYKFELENEVH